jgi:hypothetical protein
VHAIATMVAAQSERDARRSVLNASAIGKCACAPRNNCRAATLERLRNTFARRARTSTFACIPTRMTSSIVVGVYESRREADDARAVLIERGIAAERVAIEEAPRDDQSALPPGSFAMHAIERLPREHGVAAVIGRMFSGALMDDANVVQYTHALRSGKCVVAVRTQGEAEAGIASALLARAGPRVYSLPDAPTAWREATAGDPARIGGVDRDPARPGGLLAEAEGLPAESDRTRLSSGPRTR